MRDISKKGVEKTAQKYIEAVDDYRKLVDKCVSAFGPGVSTFTPKVLTRETLEELNKANAKVTKAHQKFMETVSEYTQKHSPEIQLRRLKGAKPL